MANASAGVNYIVGTGQGSVNTTRFWGDSTVKTGNPTSNKYMNFSVGDRLLSSDLSLGGVPFVHTSGLLNRCPNIPSGYDIKRKPTFGDGKQNKTVQIGPDNVWVKTAASFNYLGPRGSVKTKFSSLS